MMYKKQIKNTDSYFQDSIYGFYDLNMPRLFELRERVWTVFDEGTLRRESIKLNLVFNLDHGIILGKKLTRFNKAAARILYPHDRLCLVPIKVNISRNFSIAKQGKVLPLNFNKTKNTRKLLSYYDKLFKQLLLAYNQINSNYFKTAFANPNDFLLFEEYYNEYKEEAFIYTFQK